MLPRGHEMLLGKQALVLPYRQTLVLLSGQKKPRNTQTLELPHR